MTQAMTRCGDCDWLFSTLDSVQSWAVWSQSLVSAKDKSKKWNDPVSKWCAFEFELNTDYVRLRLRFSIGETGRNWLRTWDFSIQFSCSPWRQYRTDFRYIRYLIIGIRYFSVFRIPTSVSVSIFQNIGYRFGISVYRPKTMIRYCSTADSVGRAMHSVERQKPFF